MQDCRNQKTRKRNDGSDNTHSEEGQTLHGNSQRKWSKIGKNS